MTLNSNQKLFPEKYAKILVKRRKLVPPVDIESLVEEYAELIYDVIPIQGIDGVSVNIKVPGKTPRVIVQASIPPTRQRFTLAHELGHIIIPWHVGDLIIDYIAVDNKLYKDLWAHQEIERQANQFAAEILMPEEWIKELFDSELSLADIHRKVTQDCIVSPIAAALRIIDLHNIPIAFFELDPLSFIHGFGQSIKAKIISPEIGSRIDRKLYESSVEEISKFPNGVNHYLWYKFKAAFDIESLLQSDQTWREILEKIVGDISPENPTRFKQSLNGVIASENGVIKMRGEQYSAEILYSACLRRLQRPEFKELISHTDFPIYLAKKIYSLVYPE